MVRGATMVTPHSTCLPSEKSVQEEEGEGEGGDTERDRATQV